MTPSILFENASLLDTGAGLRREGHHVLVEGERIKEVSDRPIRAAAAERIDLGGRTLMPGLIDCHVHVTAGTVRLDSMAAMAPSYATAHAGRILAGMLRRGFTTVRDAGGADWGLKAAVAEGLIAGPRLFISGKILTQTGGNVDFRARTQGHPGCIYCDSGAGIGRVVDGITEMRRAARDELRKGADQIKINASGGVSSPSGTVTSLTFSLEELRAVCEEAEAAETYVMAHAYTGKQIARAVGCGVRTIEHGNLIDAEAAAAMAERGAYMVPTLSIYHALRRHGRELGYHDSGLAKLEGVIEAGFKALALCKEKGVKIGHGSDLLGELHRYQSGELSLKAEVLTPAEALAAVTVVNAEILCRAGELGVVAPGALADLLVVDGDPLRDLGVLQGDGKHILAVMKGGAFFENRLDRAS